MPHLIPPPQVRNRKPWTKLINNFIDTFFSGPILCKMGESFETLEGREKQAMGKDVFKTRTKADAKKTKADAKKKKADENNKY